MLLNICVGEIHDDPDAMPKPRFRNKENDYLKQGLDLFTENAPVSVHNDVILNELNNMPIEINSSDTFSKNRFFSEAEIVAVQNCKASDAGDLP